MTKSEALAAIEDRWSALIVGAPWMSDALKVAKDALRETETDGDLISRQAAIDAIVGITNCGSLRELYEYVVEHDLKDRWSGGLVDAADAVIGLPSVQPDKDLIHLQKEQAYMQGYEDGAKTRKKGKWRHYEGYLTCSECRTEYDDDIMTHCCDDVPKFCPNCGVRMEE